MTRKIRGGRPLRFLAMTLGGWTAARIVLLWPATAIPGPVPAMSAALAIGGSFDPSSWLIEPTDRPGIARWPRTPASPARTGARRLPPSIAIARRGGASPTVALALAALVRYGEAVANAPGQAGGAIAPPLMPVSVAATRSRLAGSAWIIARGSGSNGSTLLGGQLGASQAGARLTYALGEARRVALSARFATPLRGAGKEAAVGVDWQPTRLPLHLLAEQRVSLDGQHGGPALLAIGGVDPTPVLAGFKLEGYGQAGAIRRANDAGGVEAFGDGAARLTHMLAMLGPARIDLGGGAWGAAQRGVRRLDLGPTIGAVLPVADKAIRVTLDWRQRIAGNARPGSGPALAIGTDF